MKAAYLVGVVLLIVVVVFVLRFMEPHLSNITITKQGQAEYGTRVIFEPGVIINFPDFSLVYVGQSEYPVPNSTLKIVYDNFKLTATTSSGLLSKNVSWSSGTGLVMPASFTFNGKYFTLEKGYSEKLGTNLKDNEIVINKVDNETSNTQSSDETNTATPADASIPLAREIDLQNGEQCTPIMGATAVYQGQRMNYYCAPDVVLAGDPFDGTPGQILRLVVDPNNPAHVISGELTTIKTIQR